MGKENITIEQELEMVIETLYDLEHSLLQEGSYWEEAKRIQDKRDKYEEQLYSMNNKYKIEPQPQHTKEIWFTIDNIDVPNRMIHGSVLTSNGLEDMVLGTTTDSVFAEILDNYKNGNSLFLFKTYGEQIVSINEQLALISEDNIKERIRKIIHKENLSLKSKSKSKPIIYGSRIGGDGTITSKKKEYSYSREELSKRDLKSAMDKAVDAILAGGTS